MNDFQRMVAAIEEGYQEAWRAGVQDPREIRRYQARAILRELPDQMSANALKAGAATANCGWQDFAEGLRAMRDHLLGEGQG